ncbi:MAG: DNA/RNA non-specific endonuclease [Bacteroidales bacterium]
MRRLISFDSFSSRILIVFSLVFFSLNLTNCTSDSLDVENSAVLSSTMESYNKTGQFLKIESNNSWTISLDFGDSTEEWCTVSPKEGKGSSDAVILQYSVNNSDENRDVTINVDFENGRDFSLKMIQVGKDVVVDPDDPDDPVDPDDPDDPIDPDDPNGNSIKWVELPTIGTDADCMFVNHDNILVNGESKRNYSLYYDKSNKIALWVAYPLAEGYVGSSGRTDDWGYDPKIPEEYQPDMSSGVLSKTGTSGYDRGHQLPSGSRTGSTTMNRTTFYYSNMTAQASTMNQGVWVKLENKVRDYMSSCDTVYVVTGPILKTEESQSINKLYYKDGGLFSALPRAYFKVLLRYYKDTDTYSGIGFYYENEAMSRSRAISSSDAHSIDWFEEKTGFDFFSSLPDSVEDDVESQNNPSAWGI